MRTPSLQQKMVLLAAFCCKITIQMDPAQRPMAQSGWLNHLSVSQQKYRRENFASTGSYEVITPLLQQKHGLVGRIFLKHQLG
jgi:hypothetical protein